jgi:hypothetical protein
MSRGNKAMALRCPHCARVVSPDAGLCPRCGASLVMPLRLPWLVRLFWACPACGVEAPLVIHHPLFGTPSLGCRTCGTSWVLAREAGSIARLDPATRKVGPPELVEALLATLPPAFNGRPLPAPRLQLFPGEKCLLQSARARMLAPRQGPGHQQPAGRVAIVPRIYERVALDPYGPSPSALAIVAHGPFFVTDRRAVFLGDRKHVDAPLARLEGIEVDEGFLVLHRAARTDTFGFEGENAVKVCAAMLAIMGNVEGRTEAALSEEARGGE